MKLCASSFSYLDTSLSKSETISADMPHISVFGLFHQTKLQCLPDGLRTPATNP